MSENFKVIIKGREVELTAAEARKLQAELNNLLGSYSTVHLDYAAFNNMVSNFYKNKEMTDNPYEIKCQEIK